MINIVFKVEDRGVRVGKRRDPENKRVEIRDIIIMFMYSAIKIIAKRPLLYSVLNPETSSDSPSAKSKGVRLVSAREVVSQIRKIGNMIRRIHGWKLVSIGWKFTQYSKTRGDIRIRAMDTS